MITPQEYALFRDALSDLSDALSAYVNDQATTKDDLDAVDTVDRAVDDVSTRLGSFQLAQLDSTKVKAAITAIKGVITFMHPAGGGHLTGLSIAKSWAAAKPTIRGAIPDFTAQQELTKVAGPHRNLELLLSRKLARQATAEMSTTTKAHAKKTEPASNLSAAKKAPKGGSKRSRG